MLMTDDRVLSRKAHLVGFLERLCQSLELSEAQYQLAKERYEGVSAWIAAADSELLRSIVIYLQGSTALGTTVKPIARNEHDVDLIAHVPVAGTWIEPARLKRMIGDRLRASGHYAPLLEEKPRCWRLNYANEFHLDITPSILNPECHRGGELVPDRALRRWTPSNPKGYRSEFDRRAKLAPAIRLMETVNKGMRADIEPYPGTAGFKGVLRRVVQITKRHRDHHFARRDSCLAPISIILTTLAAQSYEHCVMRSAFASEFDLLCEVIRQMPAFVEKRVIAGRAQWFVMNETTTGENFAEKWNEDPRRAEAFWSWHPRALADIENLANLEGLDGITKSLRESFGSAPANDSLAGLASDVSSARQGGRLAVAPTVALVTGTAPRTTVVRPNTFFGAD
jgi:hypothetical protein